jgi:hypothetical protein
VEFAIADLPRLPLDPRTEIRHSCDRLRTGLAALSASIIASALQARNARENPALCISENCSARIALCTQQWLSSTINQHCAKFFTQLVPT